MKNNVLFLGLPVFVYIMNALHRKTYPKMITGMGFISWNIADYRKI